MAAGRVAGCSEKERQPHMSSKRHRDMPVLPKAGAGTYLEVGLSDHKLDLEPNSYLVERIKTPNILITSPILVSFFFFLNR
jgi:hypothetical protein